MSMTSGAEGRVVADANDGGKPFAFPELEDQRNFLCYHGGFWMLPFLVPGMLAAQQRMVARPDDINIASCPKAGTTWLKALVFSVVRRRIHHPADPLHPLRTANPHDCILNLDVVFAAADSLDSSQPRMWAVHTPYSALPASVQDSSCRIVYIIRDPKDVCVSMFHMSKAVNYSAANIPQTISQSFEQFCAGIHPYGPIWDHALEYWNESLKRPEKVLFLAYEEMKKDPAGNVRKLAEFLGLPFSEEEEREGMVEQIAELCSFRSLSCMSVNREGVLEKFTTFPLPRNSFFRRGEVGDWRNHLTPEMAARLDKITEEKLRGTGLKLS